MTRFTLALCVALGLAFTATPTPAASPDERTESAQAEKPKKRGSATKKAKKAKKRKKKKTQKRAGRRVKRYHMSLFNVNTKERLTNLWVIRVDDQNKDKQWVGKRARRTLTRFLRDWRTGKTKAIPERLLWHLYLVGYHFDAPLEIVSAYRHKERKSSRHKQGRAVDFRIEGVDTKQIWEYCKRFDNVGLGYYPNSDFIHMDLRDRSYYWIDESGPGQKAKYKDEVAQRKQKKKKRRKGRKKKKKK